MSKTVIYIYIYIYQSQSCSSARLVGKRRTDDNTRRIWLLPGLRERIHYSDERVLLIGDGGWSLTKSRESMDRTGCCHCISRTVSTTSTWSVKYQLSVNSQQLKRVQCARVSKQQQLTSKWIGQKSSDVNESRKLCRETAGIWWITCTFNTHMGSTLMDIDNQTTEKLRLNSRTRRKN